MFHVFRSAKRLGAAVLLMSIAACGSQSDHPVSSETKAIFGTDGRSPKPAGYPFTTVGRVVTNKGSCTGTLVGTNVVVTNAHCVIDSATKKLVAGGVRFEGDLRDGTSSNKAKALWVWWGTNDPDKFQQSDWAVLELDQDLGNRLGWMGTRDFRTYPMSVSNIGYTSSYQNGKNAGYSPSCLIHERQDDRLLHDCDTLPGHSGGPLYVMIDGGWPHLVGIHSRGYNETISEYSDEKANIGLWPAALMNKINDVVRRNTVLPLELNTDRGGQDYRNFELEGERYIDCQAACQNDNSCRAYTYVPPGVQGAKARCWLKNGVPTNRYTAGMISGVKR